MIKIKQGEVKMKGNIPTLSAEISILIKSYEQMLVENGLTKEQAQEDVDHSIALARMTEDELKDKFLEVLMGKIGD